MTAYKNIKTRNDGMTDLAALAEKPEFQLKAGGDRNLSLFVIFLVIGVVALHFVRAVRSYLSCFINQAEKNLLKMKERVFRNFGLAMNNRAFSPPVSRYRGGNGRCSFDVAG